MSMMGRVVRSEWLASMQLWQGIIEIYALQIQLATRLVRLASKACQQRHARDTCDNSDFFVRAKHQIRIDGMCRTELLHQD